MNAQVKYFYDMAEAEFRGESWNGASFWETIKSLKAAEAASTETWEGYSVWELVHHQAQFKDILARSLGFSPWPEGYPVAEINRPELPEAQTEQAWQKAQTLLSKAHKAVMAAIAAMEDSKWVEIMPEWKIPYGQAVAWLFSHDTYHTAQIRNMGLPRFKRDKTQ